MAIWILAKRELGDALRTRWFILSAAGFALLVVGLALASRSAGEYAEGAFGRTAAGLINLVLLVLPLLGLTAGALSIAVERERGTLAYLLAQPVAPYQVYLGKYLGTAGALLAVVLSGLGLGGLVLSAAVLPDLSYGWLALLTCLLALASLAAGYLISALSTRVATALGGAIFLWLALVLLGDLGLMGSATITRVNVQTVFGLSLLNPLQVYRAAAVALLEPSLEVLGPVGSYASHKLGGSLLPVFTLLLGAWTAAPIVAGCALFQKRDI